MHLEDIHAAFQVGIVDGDLPVEAAGAQQRGVEDVAAVGGRHDDDAFVHRKAVHLHQQLVKGLFALVVTAAQTRAAMAAHGVDLVDKDDGRRGLLGLVKQIAHAAGAHAHEHLHKIRTGDGEKRRVRLAGHGLGQQRLARARRAHQQHALGDARAHIGVGLGVFQEIDHFLKLFLFLLGPGHILEGDGVLGGVAHAGAAFAEVHDFAVAAALARHDEIPGRHGDDDHQDKGQKLHIPRRNHGRAVFHGKRQIAHADLVQGFSLRGRGHLAHGVDKVRADGGLKVVAALREIRVGHSAVAIEAHQRRASDGHRFHIVLTDGREQFGILDAAVNGLPQPAVEGHGDQDKCGDQRHIAHHSSLVLFQNESPPCVQGVSPRVFGDGKPASGHAETIIA